MQQEIPGARAGDDEPKRRARRRPRVAAALAAGCALVGAVAPWKGLAPARADTSVPGGPCLGVKCPQPPWDPPPGGGPNPIPDPPPGNPDPPPVDPPIYIDCCVDNTRPGCENVPHRCFRTTGWLIPEDPCLECFRHNCQGCPPIDPTNPGDPPPENWGFTWGDGGQNISINGIGQGGARKNDLLRAGDVAGPAAVTNNPVLAASGFKVEDYTDLVVELPGRNFELTRNFAGVSRFVKVGAFGPFQLGGWTSSIDTTVFGAMTDVAAPSPDLTNDPWKKMGMVFLVPSPIRDTIAFQNYTQYKPEHVWYQGTASPLPVPNTTESERREFRPLGPGLLRVRAEVMQGRNPDKGAYTHGGPRVTLPVWKVVDPGSGTSYFFRDCMNPTVGCDSLADNPSSTPPGLDAGIDHALLAKMPPGRLWKQIDEYGNTWTYEYEQLPVGNAGQTVPRLSAIYLHGEDDQDENTRAVVRFSWGIMAQPGSNGGAPEVVGSGIYHLRQVRVERPYFVTGTSGTTRSSLVTDYVKYIYRGDVEVLTGIDNQTWLGTPDDLVLVTRMNAVQLPAPTNDPRLGSTAMEPKFHISPMHYRYAYVIADGKPSAELKGAYSPEQIERFARLDWSVADPVSGPETLVQRGRRLLGWSTMSDRDNVEAAAWGIATLDDATPIAQGPPGSTPPQIALWRASNKWVTYYGFPAFNGGAVIPISGCPFGDCNAAEYRGRTQYEFLMPGDTGHMHRLLHYYAHDRDNLLDSVVVRRVASAFAPSGPNGTFQQNYRLRSNVLSVTESSRRTDSPLADDELGDAAWTPRRRTSHRSEERELFSLCYEQVPAPGARGYQWFVSSVPFTVADMVEDLQDPGRRWLTVYEFDKNNRPWRTYDPAALAAIAQPIGARLERWSDFAAQADQTRLGSITTVRYTEDEFYPASQTCPSDEFKVLIAQQLAGAGPELTRGWNYQHNYPATMRVAAKYAGKASPGSPGAAQLLNAAAYRGTLGRTGRITDTQGPIAVTRPDLLQSNELSRDGADPAPGPDSRERTSYAFGFRTANPALLDDLGFAPLSRVDVVRERETVAENGPPSTPTVTTTTWLDDLGRVVATRRPAGVEAVCGYDPHDVTGAAVANLADVTLTNPGAGEFTGKPTTLLTSSSFEVSGRLIAEIGPDGVARSLDYDVLPYVFDAPPAMPVHTLRVTEYPHDFVDAQGAQVFSGPARAEWYSTALRPLRTASHEIWSLNRDAATGIVRSASVNTGVDWSRSETDYLGSGLGARERSWAFASTGGVFPSSVPADQAAAYTATTVYDGFGDAVASVDPAGNLTLTSYDARGRLTRTDRSVVLPDGSIPAPVKVEERFYDGELGPRTGVGDGLLTLIKTFPDGPAAAARGSRNWYDRRNRLILTAPVSTAAAPGSAPVVAGPYTFTRYDNLDRVVFTVQMADTWAVPADPDLLSEDSFLSAPAALGFTKTVYSQRGLVCRTLRLIDRADAAAAKYLVSDHWVDDLGREIASTAANAPSTKRVLDAHGRTVTEVQTVDSQAPAWAEATGIDSGFVLHRIDHIYHDNRTLVAQRRTRIRAHSDIPATGTLPNGTPASADAMVATYTGFAYDAAGRTIATIDYGTNAPVGTAGFSSVNAAGAPYPAPALIPFPQAAGSWDWLPAGAIVTRTTHNARGQAEIVGHRLDDARWLETRSYFDSLGRTFATAEGYTAAGGADPLTLEFEPGLGRWRVAWFDAGDNDANRVVSTVFDALGRERVRTAHMRDRSGETAQSTGYRYVWTAADAGGDTPSLAPSNGVLYQISYPATSGPGTGQPSGQAFDQVRFGYTALGEQSVLVDQNNTRRVFIRDPAGRIIADRVTRFGARSGLSGDQHVATVSVADDVSQLVTKYDSWGRTAGSVSCLKPAGSGYNPSANLDPAMPLATMLDNLLVHNFVTYSYSYLNEVLSVRQSAAGRELGSGYPFLRSLFHDYTTTPVTDARVPGRAYRRLAANVHPVIKRDADPTQTTVTMNYTGPVDGVIGRVSSMTLRDQTSSMALVGYTRSGVARTTVVDLLSVKTQLDRTVTPDGSRYFGSFTSAADRGRYGGWDRFGRVAMSSWVASRYSGRDMQPIAQERYEYDLASRRTLRDNTRRVYLYRDQDWRFEFDRLSRLVASSRGQTIPSDFVRAPGSKRWDLDELGNFRSEFTLAPGGAETQDARTYTASNELAASAAGFRFYDTNGNVRLLSAENSPRGPAIQTMTFDAWNRMTRYTRALPGGQKYSATYDYNPLNWKVRETVSLDAPRPIKKVVWTFYSEQWQQLLEVTDDAFTPAQVDRFEQQFWGLRATDDALLRRIDTDGGGSFTNPGDVSYYQFTDANFSVIAHMDVATGAVRQWMSYDAYGNTRTLLPADFNGDGVVDDTDIALYREAFTAGIPAADFDGDGAVRSEDYDAFARAFDAEVSSTFVPDTVRIGYGGYVVDASGLLLARARWYDPEIGRWLSRDPAGYVDGMSMYLYVRGNPVLLVDPSGLGLRAWILTGEWNPAPEVLAAAQHGFAQGAHDGFVVTTNAAAKSLTFGTVGRSLDELKASGALHDPDNPLLKVSEGAGHVAGTALQTAAMGGLAQVAECGTATGNIVKAGLEAKAAYDKAESIVDAGKTVIEAGERAASGDWSGAGEVLLEKGIEAGAQYAAGKALNKFANGVKCFASGTLVWTPSGAQPIETLSLGQRVITPGDALIPETVIDPELWRTFVLETQSDAGRAGQIEVLRPASWLVASCEMADKGGVWVGLSIPEFGVNGVARVVEIRPCPAVERGGGRVVLMKSTTAVHGQVVHLKLSEDEQPVVVTGGHGLFSLDRAGFIPAGSLIRGERMRTKHGSALVESVATLESSMTVYNLEVEGEHCYFVGASGVLSHNGEECGPRETPYRDPKRPNYNNGATHMDHEDAKVWGGTSANRPLAAETNMRRGGYDGALRRDYDRLIQQGLSPEKARQAVQSEIDALKNSPPPRPMDPRVLDRLPSHPRDQ